MASLEQRGNRYRVAFRLGGVKQHVGIKAANRQEAESFLARIEENLRLVERGRLVVPEGADLGLFLLTDGRLDRKVAVVRVLRLSELFEKYRTTFTLGAKEKITRKMEDIHLKHLLRIIGDKSVPEVSSGVVQQFVDARGREKYLGHTVKSCHLVQAAGRPTMPERASARTERTTMTQSAINYTPGHLYPIALLDPDWLLYQPGTLPDGDLAVIGQLPQSGQLREPGPYPVDPLVGLFFSADGRYLRHEFLPIPAMIDPAWGNARKIDFQNRHIADGRSRWARGIGFMPGTINVQHFSLPELRIGIADWPRHLFRERLEAGSDPELLAELDEDERHQNWIEGGYFVLFWGNDFWMSPDGTIDAS